MINLIWQPHTDPCLEAICYFNQANADVQMFCLSTVWASERDNVDWLRRRHDTVGGVVLPLHSSGSPVQSQARVTVCMEFLCMFCVCSCVCVGLPPGSHIKHICRWIGYDTFAPSCECTVCVNVWWTGWFPQCTQCSWDRLWIQYDPDQDEVLTEDEWTQTDKTHKCNKCIQVYLPNTLPTQIKYSVYTISSDFQTG